MFEVMLSKMVVSILPIKVLHTLCRAHSGGVEQRRLLLATHLPRSFEHCLICQEGDERLIEQFRAHGWSVHEIGLAPHILNWAWHAKAYEIARQFRPDIVHGAVYEGEALACGIGLRMPKVKVIMEETSDPVDRRWTGNALMRSMCLRADLCVGVSPRVTEYLSHKIHTPARKIRLVNNAVAEVAAPCPDRLAELRRSFGITPSDRIVGSVGRVVDAHKKFSDIVKALPAVRRRHPETRLLIVGDGPDRAMLADLARAQGVENAVIFAGYQAQARDFYHLMDVFVLASAYEAFGLVLVEAMLANVPIIGTRVGGIPFVLADGKAGRLVPPSDPTSLGDAICDLFDSDATRRSLAAAGFARAQKEFSSERYVREISQLYHSVLRD